MGGCFDKASLRKNLRTFCRRDLPQNCETSTKNTPSIFAINYLYRKQSSLSRRGRRHCAPLALPGAMGARRPLRPRRPQPPVPANAHGSPAHCVDLGESFPTHIFLQNLASIQLRTSPVKFACSPRTDPPGLFLFRSFRGDAHVRVVQAP